MPITAVIQHQMQQRTSGARARGGASGR
jgi:hypothetical protein